MVVPRSRLYFSRVSSVLYRKMKQIRFFLQSFATGMGYQLYDSRLVLSLYITTAYRDRLLLRHLCVA